MHTYELSLQCILRSDFPEHRSLATVRIECTMSHVLRMCNHCCHEECAYIGWHCNIMPQLLVCFQDEMPVTALFRRLKSSCSACGCEQAIKRIPPSRR